MQLEEVCRVHSPVGIPDEEAKGPKNNIFLIQNDAETISDLSKKNSRIKCLRDILSDSDSDTSISIDSCYSSSMEETFAEVLLFKRLWGTTSFYASQSFFQSHLQTWFFVF